MYSEKTTKFKEISLTDLILLSKGQLISKCSFGVIIWTKIQTKIFPEFLPYPLKRGQIKKEV